MPNICESGKWEKTKDFENSKIYFKNNENSTYSLVAWDGRY